MKKVLAILSILIISNQTSFSATGGPDAYGYIWMDSYEPGGPTFSWWDISTIGSPVGGLGDDNYVGPKPIGGNFQYYWYSVDKCWIGSNGYMIFGAGDNLASFFPPIPQAGGVADNYITGMMSDLNFIGATNPARCYYHFNADSFCLSYVNVPFWQPAAPGYSGANSFQIILNRLDNSITVNFLLQTGFSSNNNTSIGMENVSGAIGLNHSTNVYPPTNYTIKYYYPASPSLLVTDANAKWNNAEGSPAIFLKNNGPAHTMISNVKNDGNVNISPFTVTAQMINSVPATVVTSTATTNLLIPAQDTVINHTNTFSPTPPGTYTFRTSLSGIPGDATPGNNTRNQEVVVIDTTLATIRLNYNDNNTDLYSGSISWTGGGGGVGMYFKPPSYPAKILSTSYMIAALPTVPPPPAPPPPFAFYAQIYDDNGPGGTPGTLLDSVPVLPGAVTLAPAITTIPVSNAFSISSGGVYVLWNMGGDGAAIAYTFDTPISYQTYEVFPPFWSDYRDREIHDFFISLDYTFAIPEDVGVPVVVSPTPAQVIAAPITVSAWLKNFGTQPDNYLIQMNYNLSTSGIPVTEMYTGTPIPAGDSVLFTFATTFSPPYGGNDTLCVYSYKGTDINVLNDSTCVAIVLVGINELENQIGVTLYPNPTSGNISLQFNKALNDEAVIEIYDMLGNAVMKTKTGNIAAAAVYNINIGKLPNAIYNCRIRSGDKITNLRVTKAN